MFLPFNIHGLALGPDILDIESIEELNDFSISQDIELQQIFVNATIEQPLIYSIYNGMGEIILSSELTNNSTTIDLSAQSKGG